MPTYEYRCQKCKEVFEIFHSIATLVTKCPHCGGRLDRLITPNAGLIFKGSGFYQTDYKRKSDGNGNGSKRTKDKVEKEKKTEKVKEESKTNKKE